MSPFVILPFQRQEFPSEGSRRSRKLDMRRSECDATILLLPPQLEQEHVWKII